jgi:hypothetical protein
MGGTEHKAKAAQKGTTSDELRARGNAELRAAGTAGLSLCLKIVKLEKALQWYDKAASAAATNPEWLSAHKNMALTYRKLAAEKAGSGADFSAALHYQILACSEFGRALCKCEGEDRQHSWAGSLEAVFVLALQEAAALVVQCAGGALDWRKKAGMLARVRRACGQCREAAALLDAIEAEELVKATISSDEAGDWRGTKNCVAEATQPLERAKAILPLDWCVEADTSPAGVRRADDLAASLGPLGCAVEAAVRETAGQLALYAARADAAQHCSIADAMLSGALPEQEMLQDALEVVWDAADHLQHAVLVSRNLNIEGEAIASAKLGEVFKVLRLDDLAQRWCKQAIVLAQTIMTDTGVTFHSQSWYKGAAAVVQQLRQTQWAADQDKLRLGKKEVLAELKPALDAIKQAVHKDKSLAKRAYDLIKHVYSEHPPKKSEWVAASVVKIAVLDGDPYAKKELKSFIVKSASLHYHPDKNKDSGVQWIVLCEQVQCEFNGLVGEMKSLPGWQ